MNHNGIERPKIEELIKTNKDHACPERIIKKGWCVRLAAIGNLPSRFGDFQIAAFYTNEDHKEHATLVQGDVCGKEDVPVRLHSECLTGDATGSLRCDCRDQLIESLKFIGKQDHGAVLYLRQEGRGIGLTNKIKAYQLQDEGYDTVEANLMLGFKDDERDYAVAAHMVNALQIKSIKLITNNPKKINDLKKHGIKVTGRISLEIPPNEYNIKYLQTKRDKSGHLLKGLPEQRDDLKQS